MTKEVKQKVNKQKKILSELEKTDKRKKIKFRNKIKYIFNMAGFTYINTENQHIKIGDRTIEIDFILLYKNIMLICEDTMTKTDNIKDHVRNKKEAFIEIGKNFSSFYKWLYDKFLDYQDIISKYDPDLYEVKFLYFSKEELNFTESDYRLFQELRFVKPSILTYFHKMTKCIKRSIKYEIFKFLDLTNKNIGIDPTESSKKISATIISPEYTTGINNKVKKVSFMMSADMLIKNAYVLRKDNWEDSSLLYQRLIQEQKIKDIREFLLKKKEAFYNNIIVALPDDVEFHSSKENKVIDLENIGKEHLVCNMTIPDRMNSICVIDGQHRIYAHHEGGENDKGEAKMSEIRKKLHLLVTGLIFPKGMSDIEKIKIQSEIFLDINSNAKSVSQDVLLHIRMVKDPISDLGLARSIIEKLNKEQIFLNKFEMSLLDNGKIKIASIIKFALRYLITITPGEKKNLYSFWKGDKIALQKMDDKALEEYKNFCIKNIVTYFSAIKKNFKKEWDDIDSKLLSVISLNGFIIAYNKLINMEGICNFDHYDNLFSKLKIDFSKNRFPYTSSQYAKFSEEILDQIKNTHTPDI